MAYTIAASAESIERRYTFARSFIRGRRTRWFVAFAIVVCNLDQYCIPIAGAMCAKSIVIASGAEWFRSQVADTTAPASAKEPVPTPVPGTPPVPDPLPKPPLEMSPCAERSVLLLLLLPIKCRRAG